LSGECQAHSGVTARVENLEKWKENHDEVVHIELNKKIDRLPNWAVWAMAAMSGTIGFLAGIAYMAFKG